MQQQLQRSNPHKAFVKVRADHEIGGRIIPLKFREADGEPVIIDRILDIRPAPSLKAGGQGIRYTCRISGQQTYLFLDENRWFVEARHPRE